MMIIKRSLGKDGYFLGRMKMAIDKSEAMSLGFTFLLLYSHKTYCNENL